MSGLERGDRVAWTFVNEKGAVYDKSVTHRVFDGQVTFCSRAIPGPDRRIAIVTARGRCSRCERMYQNAQKYGRSESRKAMSRGAP